jgi:Family of unknown function (DUF6352)
MAQDFWRNSGFHLLEREAGGRLAITDAFLRAYYWRPEIRPVEESGDAEIALHDALMDAPAMPVRPEQLDAIADTDARDNYRILLDFRERLLAAPTLEACYLDLFAGGNVNVPPLFIDQLAQIILRNILDGVDDTLELRAAELFYREQKATLQDGAIMLADLETVEMHAAGGQYGSIGRLIVETNTPTKSIDLDVLDTENAQLYWQRDQRHDLVISMNQGRASVAAFCRVIERWIAHFSGVKVAVKSLPRIEDARWAWHIGLDIESTALLNDLWRGEEVEAGRLARLLTLFRMDFADPADMRADIAGKPVYLALCMNEDNVVRMKPQNLLINLPLARAS